MSSMQDDVTKLSGTFPYHNKPLELIHSDVVDPINLTSHYRNKYFITFVDDFSRFTVVYFMATKDQAFRRF